MRLLPVVCLASVVGAPALASADKVDKAPDENPVEWGVGAQARRSRVSVRLQKLFLDGSPGPATQDGGSVTFVRRSKQIDIVLGFGYDPIHAVEGYYLSLGGDPMESGDADYVTFDDKLSWFTFDVSFIGRAKLHKILSLRFGAGVGIGVIRGNGYRTSAICTSDQLQRDCAPDPDGERQDKRIDVPVFPVLNVLTGLELRPVRWLALHLDVGLHTAPHVAVGLTLYPWKS